MSDEPETAPSLEEFRSLAAREREQRALLSTISGMVYRGFAVPPWRFTYVSDGVELLTGYPPSYFLDEGHHWAEIMVPEDVEPIAKELAVSAAEGREVQVEYRIRRRDGTIRWVEGRVRTFAGEPPVYAGTVFDIDARKRIEQDLAESREHQRYLIESVPSTLWTARLDGAIEFATSAGRTYIGAPIKQRLGHGWLTFVHPDDRERVKARWTQSLTTGDPYDASFRQSDMNGGYRWLQARAICRRDAEGDIVRWYGATNDVTELVHTQAQLHDSEELASATIQTVPGIVWRADAAGMLNFISDACESQLGWSAAEVTGNRWFELVHPDDAPALSALWSRALVSGEPIDTRYRVRNKQGTYRWHQARAIAGRDQTGRVNRWNGLAIDIEELLQARLAAESAVRAKSAFLSTMSHEIRTPLNAVLGYASLLADTPLDPEQRDFVDSIHASGDHLLAVINDVLDFSKLESKSLALDYAPCDLRELVESSLDLVASQAAGKGLELNYRIEDGVPLHLLIDPARIKQVLVNLLSNAVKFTEKGEVEVVVCARSLQAGETEFQFQVRDTGIGIPADSIGRLFRDFSQLDDSVSRRYGGTGLGLAISKRLVEAHGGTLHVSSQPGCGSTFRFCIPAKPCEPSPQLRMSASSLRGRRVLVVDDNHTSLDHLCALMRSWGIEAAGHTHPDHAVEAVVAAHTAAPCRPFDLAVLDAGIPPAAGLELARRLQESGPLPTLLLTTLGTVLDPRGLGQTVAWGVQTKPVHVTALYESLCRLLSVPIDTAGTATPRTEPEPMPALRLLLAEDNPANRKVAQLLLRKLGYTQLDIVSNGREAVQAVRHGRYDLVLMDVQMPELDGLDAARMIRHELPVDQQPQIVALTANATIDDREACVRAGMDGYLSKPIDATRLAQALRAAAERLARRAVSTPTDAPRPH